MHYLVLRITLQPNYTLLRPKYIYLHYRIDNKHIIQHGIKSLGLLLYQTYNRLLMKNRCTKIQLLSLLFAMTPFAAQAQVTETINWTSSSKDALDSMPLSGHKGAGANVWVQDGRICLYLSHNGAYGANSQLKKIGCIYIEPEGIKLGGQGFSQTLDPATGTITIKQGDFSASLWFADEALVMESKENKPYQLKVSYFIWREETLFSANNGLWTAVEKVPDMHASIIKNGTQQGITPDAVRDILSNRTFGVAIAADGGLDSPAKSEVSWADWLKTIHGTADLNFVLPKVGQKKRDGRMYTAQTKTQKQQTIVFALGAAQNATPAQWQQRAQNLLQDSARAQAKKQELKDWNEFWNRSHIIVNADRADTDPGRNVGRNYQLFRYMLACNRGGELPLLFNGGIFTVAVANGRINGMTYTFKPRGEEHPDFRRWWGTRFMSQNQRWMGWPTLAAGDNDLYEPTRTFYREGSYAAASRAKANGAEGVVYPESMDLLKFSNIESSPTGLCGSKHLTYHFSMGLENAWMALQARNYLGVDITKDIPWIAGTVIFYDTFYRNKCKELTGKELGDDNKLILYPCNGLELVSGATNPVEVVCGLTRVCDGLLSLKNLDPDLRQRITEIQERLPAIPVGERNGVQSILEAKSYEKMHNRNEPIEMYAYWPYRLAGITAPGTLQLARNTWNTIPKNRVNLCKKLDYSWMANVVNTAALAIPEESEERVIYKLGNIKEPQSRFPAFFGPGHDWIPDHNWGGSGMVGLQEMLMAAEPDAKGKIHLFPSWPKDWDADFKLYAPGNTLVECVYKNGKIEKLKVTPQERENDIVNWLGKWPKAGENN